MPRWGHARRSRLRPIHPLRPTAVRGRSAPGRRCAARRRLHRRPGGRAAGGAGRGRARTQHHPGGVAGVGWRRRSAGHPAAAVRPATDCGARRRRAGATRSGRSVVGRRGAGRGCGPGGGDGRHTPLRRRRGLRGRGGRLGGRRPRAGTGRSGDPDPAGLRAVRQSRLGDADPADHPPAGGPGPRSGHRLRRPVAAPGQPHRAGGRHRPQSPGAPPGRPHPAAERCGGPGRAARGQPLRAGGGGPVRSDRQQPAVRDVAAPGPRGPAQLPGGGLPRRRAGRPGGAWCRRDAHRGRHPAGAGELGPRGRAGLDGPAAGVDRADRL